MLKSLSRIFFTAWIAIFGTLSAYAYTVDRIVAEGEWMAATYKYLNEQTYSMGYCLSPYEDETLHLSKIDDTHILLSGFGGTLDFVFELVDSNGNLDPDGTELQISGRDAAVNGTTLDGLSTYRIMPIVFNAARQTYSAQPSKHWILKVKQDADGSLYLEEDDSSLGVFLAYNVSQEPPYYSNIIGHTVMRPFDGMAWCTDTYVNWMHNSSTAQPQQTQRVERTYPVSVEMDFDNNRFTIANLSNRGHAYDNSYNNNGYSEKSYLGKPFYVGGTIVPGENKLVFDKNQYARYDFRPYVTYGWFGQEIAYDWFAFRLHRFDFNDQQDELFGWYTLGDEDHPAHNDSRVAHGWVTNGGKRRTFNGLALEIETYSYVTLDQLYYAMPNWCDSYENTFISAGECTLDVNLTLNDMKWNDENVYVDLSINTVKNDMYVDHYEIMLVSGHHDNIYADTFREHPADGFENAVMIADRAFDDRTQIPARVGDASVSHDYSVRRLIPISELAPHASGSGEYTFFIRAHYKEDTGLTPTFHSLVHMPEPPVPTGATDIEVDRAAAPEYYTTQGVRVYPPLAPGIYICRRGASVTKETII